MTRTTQSVPQVLYVPARAISELKFDPDRAQEQYQEAYARWSALYSGKAQVAPKPGQTQSEANAAATKVAAEEAAVAERALRAQGDRRFDRAPVRDGVAQVRIGERTLPPADAFVIPESAVSAFAQAGQQRQEQRRALESRISEAHQAAREAYDEGRFDDYGQLTAQQAKLDAARRTLLEQMSSSTRYSYDGYGLTELERRVTEAPVAGGYAHLTVQRPEKDEWLELPARASDPWL